MSASEQMRLKAEIMDDKMTPEVEKGEEDDYQMTDEDNIYV